MVPLNGFCNGDVVQPSIRDITSIGNPTVDKNKAEDQAGKSPKNPPGEMFVIGA